METAYTMITQNKQRLATIDSGEVIGIIREQDLFFEIEIILREVWWLWKNENSRQL